MRARLCNNLPGRHINNNTAASADTCSPFVREDLVQGFDGQRPTANGLRSRAGQEDEGFALRHDGVVQIVGEVCGHVVVERMNIRALAADSEAHQFGKLRHPGAG